MPTVIATDLAAALEQLQAQMAEMSRHIEFLERRNAADGGTVVVPAPPVSAAAVHVEPLPAAITEEELLAISAALGAYLGVRPHIRQIRLVSTAAWAQQGRVSIQASHTLQG
jgi:methylmalonyl-CoA carboxyltransferase large subunit